MSSVYDLVGPVLPQALRLARYQASTSLPQNFKDLPRENDMINQTPSREEERLLVSNANVVTALEDVFSWIEKDPTSRTSKLSRVESVRFRRAVYRVWLMSVLFGPRRFVSWLLPDRAIDRKSDLCKSWKDQKTFLRQFSSPELFQIDKLATFLTSIAAWAVKAEGGDLQAAWGRCDWDGMYLFAGPHAILCCYEDETSSHLPTEYLDDGGGPYTNFLTRALSKIIRERQVTKPYGSYIGVILDDIYGEHTRCDYCGEDDDRAPDRMLACLWNEMNWGDLKGRLDRDALVAGNLSRNLVEKPLIEALKGDWSRLLHEMFAFRHGEYAQWSKQDWICYDCWPSFFRDTMWRWRLVQKRMAGEPIRMNCKYGYDCVEQCHESGLTHAKQFNHLCEPVEETSETSSLADPMED